MRSGCQALRSSTYFATADGSVTQTDERTTSMPQGRNLLSVCSVAESCLSLCDSMDCLSPTRLRLYPWDFQARTLEWVAISLSKGSSWPGMEPMSPALVKCISYHWAIWEVQEFIQGVKRGWKAFCVYSSWNINRTGWDFSNIICPPSPLVLYPGHHNSVLLILICCFFTASCTALSPVILVIAMGQAL